MDRSARSSYAYHRYRAATSSCRSEWPDNATRFPFCNGGVWAMRLRTLQTPTIIGCAQHGQRPRTRLIALKWAQTLYTPFPSRIASFPCPGFQDLVKSPFTRTNFASWFKTCCCGINTASMASAGPRAFVGRHRARASFSPITVIMFCPLPEAGMPNAIVAVHARPRFMSMRVAQFPPQYRPPFISFLGILSVFLEAE